MPLPLDALSGVLHFMLLVCGRTLTAAMHAATI
jgi:hypothetical protein